MTKYAITVDIIEKMLDIVDDPISADLDQLNDWWARLRQAEAAGASELTSAFIEVYKVDEASAITLANGLIEMVEELSALARRDQAARKHSTTSTRVQ